MKRVLLLTHHVPPRTGIASVRIGQLIRGLSARGWEVVPLTPDFGDAHYPAGVVTTGIIDFKAPVRKLFGVRERETTSARLGIETGSVHTKPSLRAQAFRMGYGLTQYANRQFAWLTHGTRAASDLLEGARFDAVISSSPPETTHHVAARVHGTLPWIADLRDPWTQDGMGAHGGPLGTLDRLLEPRTLRGAAALTTVSEPIAQSLRERYPGKPVYCVRNAFDASDWSDVPFAHPDRARFIYAGQFYRGKRDPRPLFAAISDVLRSQLASPEELAFDFYGDDSPWLYDEIRRYGIGSVVHLHGTRTRQEILRLERSATCLLLFLWNDPRERGTYTGKLFEYLGARRPILAVGGPPETVVDEVLAATGAGERVRSIKAIRDHIVYAVTQWRRGCSRTIEVQAVAPYESTYLADAFATILDSLVAVPTA